MLQFSGDATFGKTTVGKLMSFDTFFGFLAAHRVMGEANPLACLHIAKGQLPVGFNLPLMDGVSTVGGYSMTIHNPSFELIDSNNKIVDRNNNVIHSKALTIYCQNCIDRESGSPGLALHLRSVDYLSPVYRNPSDSQADTEVHDQTRDLKRVQPRKDLPFMSQIGMLVPFVEWAASLENSGFTVHLWEYDKSATTSDKHNLQSYKNALQLIPNNLYIVTLSYKHVEYTDKKANTSVRTLICSPIDFSQTQMESRLSLSLNPFNGDTAAEHFGRFHISADESYGGFPHMISNDGDKDALTVMNNLLSSDRWFIDSSGAFNSIASRTSYGLGEGGFSQFNSVLLKHGNLNGSILASLSNAVDNGLGRRVGFDTLSEGHFTGTLQTGTLLYGDIDSFVVVTTSRPDREKVDLVMRVDYDKYNQVIHIFHAPTLNQAGMHPVRSFVITTLQIAGYKVLFESRTYNTSIKLNSTVGRLKSRLQKNGGNGEDNSTKWAGRDKFDWDIDNPGISFASWLVYVVNNSEYRPGEEPKREHVFLEKRRYRKDNNFMEELDVQRR